VEGETGEAGNTCGKAQPLVRGELVGGVHSTGLVQCILPRRSDHQREALFIDRAAAAMCLSAAARRKLPWVPADHESSETMAIMLQSRMGETV
jgi:hypothetical protein